eukprot:TRINITY_DN14332_c0_g4_i1.p1 TRINITY_DN14332_c0_g4~~TRINITY_DN14332_c0_g4_i1.p1  ORF type:complete len:634 (-),score=160.28 TRINITY_DN14332_c0_g4_i1:666-2567(-)
MPGHDFAAQALHAGPLRGRGPLPGLLQRQVEGAVGGQQRGVHVHGEAHGVGHGRQLALAVDAPLPGVVAAVFPEALVPQQTPALLQALRGHQDIHVQHVAQARRWVGVEGKVSPLHEQAGNARLAQDRREHLHAAGSTQAQGPAAGQVALQGLPSARRQGLPPGRGLAQIDQQGHEAQVLEPGRQGRGEEVRERRRRIQAQGQALAGRNPQEGAKPHRRPPARSRTHRIAWVPGGPRPAGDRRTRSPRRGQPPFAAPGDRAPGAAAPHRPGRAAGRKGPGSAPGSGWPEACFGGGRARQPERPPLKAAGAPGRRAEGCPRPGAAPAAEAASAEDRRSTRRADKRPPPGAVRIWPTASRRTAAFPGDFLQDLPDGPTIFQQVRACGELHRGQAVQGQQAVQGSLGPGGAQGDEGLSQQAGQGLGPAHGPPGGALGVLGSQMNDQPDGQGAHIAAVRAGRQQGQLVLAPRGRGRKAVRPAQTGVDVHRGPGAVAMPRAVIPPEQGEVVPAIGRSGQSGQVGQGGFARARGAHDHAAGALGEQGSSVQGQVVLLGQDLIEQRGHQVAQLRRLRLHWPPQHRLPRGAKLAAHGAQDIGGQSALQPAMNLSLVFCRETLGRRRRRAGQGEEFQGPPRA